MLISGVVMLMFSQLFNFATARENPDVGTFLRKHSGMGVYMPLVFSLRLVVLTVLLFLFHLEISIISYLIVIVQMGYLMFILFGRPHKKPFDLVRSIFLEVGLLYILVMRYVEVNVFTEYIAYDDMTYPSIAYVEYGVYGVGIILSLCSLVYHFVKKFKILESY